jgi:hypothetical protein
LREVIWKQISFSIKAREIVGINGEAEMIEEM